MANDADVFGCLLSGMKLSAGASGLIAMATYARQLAQHLKTEHGGESELPYRTRMSMSDTASGFASVLTDGTAKLKECGMPGTEIGEMRELAARLVDDIRVGNVDEMETDARNFNSYMADKFSLTLALFEPTAPIER